MPELGGFTVSIEVDGQALEEHAVQRDGEYGASCHIASVPGKAFVINIMNASQLGDPTQNIIAMARTFLDGTPGSYHTRLGTVTEGEDGSFKLTSASQTTISGFRVSHDILKQFTFSRVKLTEDDSCIESNDDVEAIGTIKVEIEFHKFLRMSSGSRVKTVAKSEVLLSERTKKGGGHCAILGEEKSAKGKLGRSRPCKDMPAYTFIFRHASKDWLQAKEIIMPADPKSKLKVEPDWPAANSSPPINQKTAKRKIEAPQVIDTDTDIESLHEEARISTAKARLAVANAELALAEIEEQARARKRAKMRIKAEPGTSSQPDVIELSD